MGEKKLNGRKRSRIMDNESGSVIVTVAASLALFLALAEVA